jgi:cytochrome P450
MQPVFHAKKIRHYAALIAQHTQKMLDHWQSGAEYNIAHEMMTLTMGIIAQIIFNIDVVEDAKHIGDAFTITAEMVMLESTNILHAPDWMPTPRNLRENRAMQDLREFLGTIIEERHKSNEDKGDLLSMLLAARDEDGEGMTDEQIYDELVTLFAAGHETSANTLNWMWVLLSQNADEEAKLYEHVKSALNGKAPTFEDLEKIPRLEMVLKETMRVYPTLWVWQREALEDVEIGGYTIPKGGVAYVSPWVMHHQKRFWQEPQKFDPERFSPEREKEIPDYAYFPFGGGPRVCIGNHLAMLEMQIIAAMMLQRFKLERVSNEPVEVEPLIAIRPKGGLPMRVTAR